VKNSLFFKPLIIFFTVRTIKAAVRGMSLARTPALPLSSPALSERVTWLLLIAILEQHFFFDIFRL
jgi:hypothetical protein